jgi:hypothetical protein
MLGERAHRHVSMGNDCHKGRMSDMTSVLHQSDTLCQRGIYYSYEGRESNQRLRNIEKYQMNLDRGRIPKEISVGGRSPKGRYPLPLMSKEER